MDKLLIGWPADWSRLLIANPDWQLSLVKRTPSPLYVSVSVIGVHFRGSLWVGSGSAQGSLWVCFSGPEADPDFTRKAYPGSCLFALSVRLSLVYWNGTNFIGTQNLCMKGQFNPLFQGKWLTLWNDKMRPAKKSSTYQWVNFNKCRHNTFFGKGNSILFKLRVTKKKELFKSIPIVYC